MIFVTQEANRQIIYIPDDRKWELYYDVDTVPYTGDRLSLYLDTKKEVGNVIDEYYYLNGWDSDAVGSVLLELIYKQIEEGKKVILIPTGREVIKIVEKRSVEGE